MDDREKRALGALAAMVRQYLEERPNGSIDSYAMSAGEHAISALAEYGYVEKLVKGRIFGRWTEARRALLDWNHPNAEQQNKTFPQPPVAASDDQT